MFNYYPDHGTTADTAGFIVGRGDLTSTPHLTSMALYPVGDDEKRVARVMVSYRQASLVRHSHLQESQRHRLWTQKLNQFQSTPEFDNESTPARALPRIGGWLPGTIEKRTRMNVNLRTLPAAEAASASGTVSGSGSGSLQAKKRATVCVTLIAFSQPSYPSPYEISIQPTHH
jgi:hypothetical protein